MEDKKQLSVIRDHLSTIGGRLLNAWSGTADFRSRIHGRIKTLVKNLASTQNRERLTTNISTFFSRITRNIKSHVLQFPTKLGRLKYYLVIWLMMSRNSFMVVLSNKLLLLMFLTGKLLRFGFFIIFLVYAVRGAGGLAGYTVEQTIFFFLTFNIVDVINQFLFREVYRFRGLITSGDLDLVMTKPMNPLFRVLMGGADVIDLITIPPLIAAAWYVGAGLSPLPGDTIFYLLLVVNGIIIGTAFHIAVLAFGIITYEVDHTILIYRDLTSLGRLPVDVYSPVIRTILTYFLPVAIMITFPAKVFMGIHEPSLILIAFILGVLSLLVSTRLWGFALRKYSSASS